MNGRIWAFVASVGANATPDIGEVDILWTSSKVSVLVLATSTMVFTDILKVLALTHQICGRAKKAFLPQTSCSTGYTQALRWKSGRENLQNGQENMGTEVFFSSGHTGHGLGQ